MGSGKKRGPEPKLANKPEERNRLDRSTDRKSVQGLPNSTSEKDFLFSNLSQAAEEKLSAITFAAGYPEGVVLFTEGQESRGVYILNDGRAKLWRSGVNRQAMILQVASAGHVLGLSATVSGRPYEVTASLCEAAQVGFIKRNEFLAFLGEYSEAALRVAKHVCENFYDAYGEMCSIQLSQSAEEKLARFLLQQADESATPHFKLALTHEELGQMLGLARETVTRSFSSLKRHRIVRIKGASLTIANREALEQLIGR